jgi:hypothetical protein
MKKLDRLSDRMCVLEDKRDDKYLTEDEENQLNWLYVEIEKEHKRLCQ